MVMESMCLVRMDAYSLSCCCNGISRGGAGNNPYENKNPMNRIHKKRLITILVLAIGISIAIGLILYALRQNINVFLTPTQVVTNAPAVNYHFRLGGMVKAQSIVRHPENLRVEFVVTDLKKELPVEYVGVLPDLFREGSGVIADGSLNANGIFIATQVLAKHDENYMPKKVYDAMRKNAGNPS